MTPEIELSRVPTTGATVVDVREADEYAAGHVPGALLVPLLAVHHRLGDLPRDQPVYVICATGNRSKAATEWMRAAGIEAFSVAGGTAAWARAGRPLATGR